MIFAPGELKTYFDATIASAEVGYIKPEPEIHEKLEINLPDIQLSCVNTDSLFSALSMWHSSMQ